MLYVFQVDTGMMLTFEMQIAMETVASLKTRIANKTNIPEDKQVLLISGGESLDSKQRVCTYSAGTDTSPIFLFTKINIESPQPPQLRVDYGGDSADMSDMIESCKSMQPNYNTLIARAELATELYEFSARQKEICERLVLDQHMQQQGWAAVTANLEDLTRAFKNKSEMMLHAFNEFLKTKTCNKDMIEKFSNDIQLLSKIPILPTLIEHNKLSQQLAAASISNNTAPKGTNQSEEQIVESANFESASEGENPSGRPEPMEESNEMSTPSASKPPQSDDPQITLQKWIDSHDSQNSLTELADQCLRGLERFNDNTAEQIRLEVQEVLKSANNSSMKEVKGLEERLFGLEKLMSEARKVVAEQDQLASSFRNHKDRMAKHRDPSILPDLCASHGHQLDMMLANHQKMNDFRRRCIRAKEELSSNLHARLRWIMYVEQQLSDLDAKLMIYRENLIRLNNRLEIVTQIHKAPTLYSEAVVEVLRRRRFAKKFMTWSSSLAKKTYDLYQCELDRRKEFDQKIGTHFLCNLFPGLHNSYPPAFATVKPEPFDTDLPRITAADIRYLKGMVDASMVDLLDVPDDVPMPQILIRSKKKSRDTCPEGPEVASENDDADDDGHQSSNPTPPSSPTG